MRKETEKLVNLLGKGTFFDNIFIFSTNNKEDINDYLEDWEKEFPKTQWIYHTITSGNYCLIGVEKSGLIAASEDFFDYCFHNKEEFYLVPFYLFSDTYIGSSNLENMEMDNFLEHLFNNHVKNEYVYKYALDMFEYIVWYKEQNYPIYEYIDKLETFLKEQVAI